MTQTEINRAVNVSVRWAAEAGASEATILAALQDAISDAPAVIAAARTADEEREGTA